MVRARLLLIVILIAHVSSDQLRGQSIHLPPAFRRDVPPDSVVLQVTRSDTTRTLPIGTSFTVDDDHLVVSTGSGIDRILIRNRTMGDLVSDLRAKYGTGILATTAYPLLPADKLESSRPASFTNNTLQVTAEPSNPEALVGFGLVLGFSGAESEGGGLLSQTGFQLDVAGVHQLRTPSTTSSGLRSVIDLLQIFAQVRVGLSADQQLVAAEPDTASRDPVSDQFQAAIEQADQISLTSQIDFVWPIQRKTEFGLTVGFGINWTQPEAFRMPDIIVRDTARSAEELFGGDRVTALTSRLNAPAALNDVSLLGIVRFHSGSKLAYYAGGGIINREVLVRGFTYRRLQSGSVDSTSLQPDMNGKEALFWQAVFGISVPGVIDVRLDGVGPTEREFERPVLRLVLSRAFPAGD